MAQAERAEHALLEAVVELEEPRRERQAMRIRRPKLRNVNSPMASTTHDRDAHDEEDRIAGGSPSRKLQYPAARPRMAMAKTSRIRSMKTVPKVRLSDAELFILSR